MADKEAINSSTGPLGPSRRQYDRLYVNGQFGNDYDAVERNFGRLIKIPERRKRFTRSVCRSLVSQNVAEQIAAGPLRQNLEVSFPVGEFTGDDSQLVYLAQNAPHRKLLTPREKMIEDTEHYRDIHISPRERVRQVLDEGFTMTDRIGENQVSQVLELWAETFGWEEVQVENLRQKILDDMKLEPQNRNFWFSAVEYEGQIVSLATAERLSLPIANGNLDLVENTEWKTNEDFVGQGLMSAVLANLNLQIVSDLWKSPNSLPLIYAECNYQSRSDRAGHGVGFTIPNRNLAIPAPQIIEQNVLVQDGQEVPEGSLRDFTFMYLPLSVINRWYNPNYDN